jgi:hypothetical protein
MSAVLEVRDRALGHAAAAAQCPPAEPAENAQSPELRLNARIRSTPPLRLLIRGTTLQSSANLAGAVSRPAVRPRASRDLCQEARLGVQRDPEGESFQMASARWSADRGVEQVDDFAALVLPPQHDREREKSIALGLDDLRSLGRGLRDRLPLEDLRRAISDVDRCALDAWYLRCHERGVEPCRWRSESIHNGERVIIVQGPPGPSKAVCLAVDPKTPRESRDKARVRVCSPDVTPSVSAIRRFMTDSLAWWQACPEPSQQQLPNDALNAAAHLMARLRDYSDGPATHFDDEQGAARQLYLCNVTGMACRGPISASTHLGRISGSRRRQLPRDADQRWRAKAHHLSAMPGITYSVDPIAHASFVYFTTKCQGCGATFSPHGPRPKKADAKKTLCPTCASNAGRKRRARR